MNAHGTIAVCSDCLVWHCNADDTGFCDCGPECVSDECSAIRNAPGLDSFEHLPHHWVQLVPEDLHVSECCHDPEWHASHATNDLGFSRSRCEACLRPDGGDRYRMAVLTP